MSALTTQILANASAEKLCDVVVIGIRPDASLYIRHSGSTVASFNLYLDLAKDEAIKSWHQAAELHEAAE